MKGKYFIHSEDGYLYSTDSYELYALATGILYDIKVGEKAPRYNPNICHTEATPEAWKLALQQEQQRYDDGFVYRSRWAKGKYGKRRKRGRWIKKEV